MSEPNPLGKGDHSLGAPAYVLVLSGRTDSTLPPRNLGARPRVV